MANSNFYNNQRQNHRVPVNLIAKISFGSQVTLMGRIRDLSLKSAFILIKGAVHMQLNDEIAFTIEPGEATQQPAVSGMARISRISAGEGIAIYFVKLDENSTNQLRKLVEG